MQLFYLLASFLFFSPQVVQQFNAGLPHTSAAGGSVAIRNHAAQTNSCTSGVACTLSGISITNTGDAEVVFLAVCFNTGSGGCTQAPAGTLTLTDGTNTYTQTSGCTFTLTAWSTYCFTAKNVTSGTYTLIFTLTGGGSNQFAFGNSETIELSGANTTNPVDSSVSNSATGNSGTSSVTSAGNVSSSGEVAIGYITVSGSITVNSPYAGIDNPASGQTVAALTGPTPGTTTTLSAAVSTGNWWTNLIAIKP